MHKINILVTFSYYCDHYICNMIRIFRNALVHKLFSLLLFSLFCLKTIGAISYVIGNKHLTTLKVCVSSEKSLELEEEKKDSEKQYKNFDCLSSAERQTLWTNGKDIRASIYLHDCVYQKDQFGSVPSPPPDYSA